VKKFVATIIIASSSLLIAHSAQAAQPITVTSSVTGSSGNYVYDFSITNNIGGTNNVYFFGVKTDSTNTIGSPANWAPSPWNNGWNNSYYGGSSLSYNNTWCCSFAGAIKSGETLSGFKVLDTGSTIKTSIPWFAFAFGGSDFNADGHFNSDFNPGFEGLTNVTSTLAGAVPEPATWALMILGFGVVAHAMRRAKAQSRGGLALA
jgi:hypothetical protein